MLFRSGGREGDAPPTPGSLSYSDEEGVESLPNTLILSPDSSCLKGAPCLNYEVHPHLPLLFFPLATFSKTLQYMYIKIYITYFVLPLTLLAPFSTLSSSDWQNIQQLEDTVGNTV